MAIASAAMGGEKAGISAIDVSRPLLWTAIPTRVDPTAQAYLRADAPAELELAARTGDLCHDRIGLRLSCDLIAASDAAALKGRFATSSPPRSKACKTWRFAVSSRPAIATRLFFP